MRYRYTKLPFKTVKGQLCLRVKFALAWSPSVLMALAVELAALMLTMNARFHYVCFV